MVHRKAHDEQRHWVQRVWGPFGAYGTRFPQLCPFALVIWGPPSEIRLLGKRAPLLLRGYTGEPRENSTVAG